MTAIIPDESGYFEVAHAAVGTRLTMYINGKELIETTNEECAAGSSMFKEVQVMLLDGAGIPAE